MPSKAERAAEEAKRREEALSSSVLDPSNKGFQMMAKLGFKPGDTLGKPKPKPTTGDGNENDASSSSMATSASEWVQAHAEPLRLVVKEDRGGIGLDTEKKRKFREEAEQVTKRAKAEVGEYRERMRAEREERRIEAQIVAAQKVAEKLDIEAEEKKEEGRENGSGGDDESSSADKPKAKKKDTVRLKPLSQIPVVYRGMVRAREEHERLEMERRRRETSLPSSFFPRPDLPGYEDPTLDRDDVQAIEGPAPDKNTSFVEQEGDEPEDPELEEFNTLEPPERLRRVVLYLREQHNYCFWCKYRYETKDMEGCPGLTEEDHD